MSDRQIVYTGAIPQDLDILNTNKNMMIALGMLSQAVLGTTTLVDGLACTPTGPASLQVLVGPGSIYAYENVDGTAYGSLAADTTHQIVKQGINLGTLTLNCAAPSTTGQSINYLIQAAYQDTDAGSTILPYYNASNPAVAYNGPANSGTSQNTVREGQCLVNAKAGVAATSGSQTTPSPDAGYVGLWVVTVAHGTTGITSGNIAAYGSAPVIGAKLTGRLSAANNLSDLGSLATALGNLGFASDGASYFKVPNPAAPSSPWIIQFGYTAAPTGSVSTTTFPIAFPNAVKALLTTPLAAAGSYGTEIISTPVYPASTTLTGFVNYSDRYAGGAYGGGNQAYYIAIGN